MNGIQGAILAALAMLATEARGVEVADEWRQALNEIDGHRCVGTNLCLGMSWAATQALFGQPLEGSERNIGQECTEGASTAKAAVFEDHDKNAYEIIYRLFPGTGSVDMRYRATSIGVTLDHGRVIKEMLIDALVRKSELTPIAAPMRPGEMKWSRSDAWTVTNLHQRDLDARDTARLTLSVEIPRYPAWISSGHVCQLAGA